ncbi:hypothetical protein TNCV_165431 [Trichonephila clavipes]|nr:hypothetical protein TNCV_165431 [Trichonephila clavipes]
MQVSSGTKNNSSPNARAILHHRNCVVRWCSLGGKRVPGALHITVRASSRQEASVITLTEENPPVTLNDPLDQQEVERGISFLSVPPLGGRWADLDCTVGVLKFPNRFLKLSYLLWRRIVDNIMAIRYHLPPLSKTFTPTASRRST